MISLATCTRYDPIQVYTFEIIKEYPHDRTAFTQGLVYENGVLYEGTGRRGESTVRKVSLETGNVLKIKHLPERFFGEGLTLYNNRLIQLTWKSGTGFVYDKDNLKLLDTFYYQMEGWGLTHDGTHLIVSNGTAKLYFLDPTTYEVQRWIEVVDSNGRVDKLNELEYVKGEIFANIWQTDRIARISPETGHIAGWIDLKGLLEEGEGSKYADVLNGIAYDTRDDRLFVTGKLWPKIFEIKLVTEQG